MLDTTFSRLSPFLPILPAAVTVIATAASLGLTWAKDLNASASRTRLLDEGTRLIDFWDKRVQIASKVEGKAAVVARKIEARDEILAATVAVRDAYARPRKYSRTKYEAVRRCLPWYRRGLLLYRPSPQLTGKLLRDAWAMRVLFYMALSFPLWFLWLNHRAGRIGHHRPVGGVLLSLVLVATAYHWMARRYENPRYLGKFLEPLRWKTETLKPRKRTKCSN